MMKFFLFVSLFVMSSQVYADFFRHWAEKAPKNSSYFKLYSSFWMSAQRVDLEGTSTSLPDGASFYSIDGGALLRYNIFSQMQIGLGVNGRMNSYSISTDSYSMNGLESASAIIKYVIAQQKRWSFAGEFIYQHKMFSNDDITSIPLGDDISTMHLKLLTTYKYSAGAIFNASVGYYRYQELMSPEISYALEMGLLYDHWDLFAGVKGNISMKTDVYTESPSTKPPIGVYATNLYNSINSERVDLYAGLIKKWKSWGIQIEGGARVMGKSTDLGYWGGLSLVRISGGISDKKIKRDKFKEYDIEGEVLKVSARGKFVKINIGLAKDLDTNMRVDIYKTDFFGGNILVATGIVQELKATWSIIRLVKKYKNIKIKKGFTARAY